MKMFQLADIGNNPSIFICNTMKHIQKHTANKYLVRALNSHFYFAIPLNAMNLNEKPFFSRLKCAKRQRQRIVLYDDTRQKGDCAWQNTRFKKKHLLPFYLVLLNGLLVYSMPLVCDLKRMKRIEKEHKQCIFIDHCLCHINTLMHKHNCTHRIHSTGIMERCSFGSI